MKKGSKSRKCGACNRTVMWFIPDHNILGIQFDRCETVREFRFRKAPPHSDCDTFRCLPPKYCTPRKFPNR